MFKSYYVVWKQPACGKEKRRKNSLNRTMQYGNYFKSDMKNLISKGLNRTMQYGNY